MIGNYDTFKAPQGGIFWINDHDITDKTNPILFEDRKDNRIRGNRPWIVVSSNKFNNYLNTVEAVPLSHCSNRSEINEDLTVAIKLSDNDTSYALIDNAMTINVFQLKGFNGMVSQDKLQEILNKRSIYMGFTADISASETFSEIDEETTEEVKNNCTNEVFLKRVIERYENGESKKLLIDYPQIFQPGSVHKTISKWYKELGIKEPKLIIGNEEDFVTFYETYGMEKTLKAYNLTPRFKSSVYQKVYSIKRKQRA